MSRNNLGTTTATHILKPESRDYPTSIYDDEFGARFARAAGLGRRSALGAGPWVGIDCRAESQH